MKKLLLILFIFILLFSTKIFAFELQLYCDQEYKEILDTKEEKEGTTKIPAKGNWDILVKDLEIIVNGKKLKRNPSIEKELPHMYRGSNTRPLGEGDYRIIGYTIGINRIDGTGRYSYFLPTANGNSLVTWDLLINCSKEKRKFLF